MTEQEQKILDTIKMRQHFGVRSGTMLTLIAAARAGGKSNIIGNEFSKLFWLMKPQHKVLQSKSKQSRMVKVKVGKGE